MKKTLENLARAFAWESQARNRYTIYASVAKKAWYQQIANVFLETAEQEKEHAEWLFKMMQEFVEKEWVEMPYIDIETTTMIKFGDTKTNLETAIAAWYLATNIFSWGTLSCILESFNILLKFSSIKSFNAKWSFSTATFFISKSANPANKVL